MAASSGTALLEIDRAFAGMLGYPTLQVNGASYSLASAMADRIFVISLKKGTFSSDTVVSISFTTGAGESVTSPLLVTY
jgi:hypothetical protein